jgi:methylaspartate ammonia-lyase
MGAKHDGLFYIGETQLEGFTAIRQAGESFP